MTRLRCDGATLRDVTALVEAHDQIRHFTRKTTCRLLSRMGIVQTRRLLQVMEADIKAQAPATVGGKMEQLLEGYARVDAVLTAGACFTKRDMALKGGDLLAMGLRPGVLLGTVLDRLFQEVLDGTLENNRDALLARARELMERKKS